MGEIPAKRFCDVCESQKDVTSNTLQIIFITEQTEGRSVNPYLSNKTIDICRSCYEYVLEGNYLRGSGAMGHDAYWFDNRSVANKCHM